MDGITVLRWIEPNKVTYVCPKCGSKNIIRSYNDECYDKWNEEEQYWETIDGQSHDEDLYCEDCKERGLSLEGMEREL